mmetsp:Transcript_41438/g.100600  ORF Transcript_41438/g.100600 Transcript_41438/m.100600 type:complete len:271 (+) Transcript_41438:66-878(+)
MAAAAARRRRRRTAAAVQAATRGWGMLRPPGRRACFSSSSSFSSLSLPRLCCLLSAVPPPAQALGARARLPASLDLCVAACRPRSFRNADPSVHAERAFCVRRSPRQWSQRRRRVASRRSIRFASPILPPFSGASGRSVCPSFTTSHSARPVCRPYSFWNADPSVHAERAFSVRCCPRQRSARRVVLRDGTPALSDVSPPSSAIWPICPLQLLAALDLSVAPTASGTPTPSVHAKRVFCVRCCPRQLSEHRAASLGRCQRSGPSVPLGRS